MRIQGRGGDDLEKAYQNYGPTIGNQAEAMLRLLASLRATESDYLAYGLTSHLKLCLLSEDRYDSDWWVVIEPDAFGYLRVEYLMPPEEAPWPGAYVSGRTDDCPKACEMVLTGMLKSGGWTPRPQR